MTPDVKDFQALIRWLADTHHRGSFNQIAKHTGLSPAIIDKWKHGLVKHPTIEALERLCESYGLELPAVLEIIMRGRLHSRSGRSRPLLVDGERRLNHIMSRWRIHRRDLIAA